VEGSAGREGVGSVICFFSTPRWLEFEGTLLRSRAFLVRGSPFVLSRMHPKTMNSSLTLRVDFLSQVPCSFLAGRWVGPSALFLTAPHPKHFTSEDLFVLTDDAFLSLSVSPLMLPNGKLLSAPSTSPPFPETSPQRPLMAALLF